MPSHPPLPQALALTLTLLATVPLTTAAPCDIYASGNTACVAAHSTTRALYSSFSGDLYEVTRQRDNATTTIKPLSAGGVADSSVQDSFCDDSDGLGCVISIIFDQSGNGNHLSRGPGGGAAPEQDTLANATGAPVYVGGKKVYGVFIAPGTGYRNNKAVKTATGDASEGMYAVVDGTYFNNDCCFDYGNGETNTKDNGNGHMEAIYFGNAGKGKGAGPWIKADLENGLYPNGDADVTGSVETISHRFVSAMLKGGQNLWAIRGGDATAGGLTDYFRGPRPANGYDPMKKEGAIILGVGGDNSNRGRGTFYEGVMTSGFPSNATEDSVQKDIVAAGYTTSA